MMTPRIWSSTAVLALVAAVWSVGFQTIDSRSPEPGHMPTLDHACVITNDVRRLVDFYEPILAQKAKWSGKDYAEFPTGAGILAVFSTEAQEKYIPGSAEAAKNRSMIPEFRVASVDREYLRLQNLVKIWVKPPTTQLWGTRSIYFRDPDGNLVDFYTPPKAQ
jgi:catechol 2,3-dioxygenase-like lactoylglutathione lyase family enzyme